MQAAGGQVIAIGKDLRYLCRLWGYRQGEGHVAQLNCGMPLWPS